MVIAAKDEVAQTIQALKDKNPRTSGFCLHARMEPKFLRSTLRPTKRWIAI
jgi:hypothetical protein